DRRRGRRWDTGVPSSLSGTSSVTAGAAAGDDDGTGPYWYEVAPDDCGCTSVVEIDVPVGDSSEKGKEDDEDDDPWSRRLDVLEQGQLHLQ
ncbi:UNVERIFIED_CONTAM: hypothetical protein K2H54_038982, partial [Gekko kuhli]